MKNISVVSINNLVKRFPMGSDFFMALKGIDLSIESGEFTGLVGSSGSGKTTLLNVIGGLDSASEGNVSVLEHSMNSTTHKERAKLGAALIGLWSTHLAGRNVAETVKVLEKNLPSVNR